MPEEQIIHFSFGEVRYAPVVVGEPEPVPARLKAISEAAAAVWTIVLRTALIGSVLVVLIVAVAEVRRDTVVIEEIGLPEALVNMGYSGAVAAQRLWDSTVWIGDHAGTTKSRTSLVADSRQLEITEPGTGLSLSGLVQVIRSLLGWEQPRIAGEFVCRDALCTLEKMELRLRAFQDGAMTVSGVGRLGSLETEAEIDAYFDRAALELLSMIDPYVRASFLYSVEQGGLPQEATDRANEVVSSLEPLPPGVLGPRSVFEARQLLSARHPQRAWAAQMLATVEGRKGNWEATIHWTTMSVRLMETDPVAPFPNAYNSWGNSLAALGRYNEAIEKYELAIEIDPAYAYAYGNFGNSLRALRRPGEAIEKYEVAIKIDPDFADAYNGLGDSLGDLRRHEEAIEKYEAAIEIDPDFADAYNGLGNSLGDLGRHEEAFEKYRAALSIDPTYKIAFSNWAITLSQSTWESSEESCALLAAELPRLRTHAVNPDWAVELDRLKGPQHACAATMQRARAR